MCGRYTLSVTDDILEQHFALTAPPPRTPRYNIAPSQMVLAIRLNPTSAQREWALLRWGLIPSWTHDRTPRLSTINAKAETVAVKPAFRSAFKHRRCLIPADGFYEWRPTGQQKQPMYIHLRARRPFAFAGLWERWDPPEDTPIESCTILTTESNALIHAIHNRMPVILPPERYAGWLDPTSPPTDLLQGLLTPYPAEEMDAYPVSTLVNSPHTDTPRCLEPIESAD